MNEIFTQAANTVLIGNEMNTTNMYTVLRTFKKSKQIFSMFLINVNNSDIFFSSYGLVTGWIKKDNDKKTEYIVCWQSDGQFMFILFHSIICSETSI